jgi:hypothetical protein
MTFPSPGLILNKPAALIVTLWTDYQPEFLSVMIQITCIAQHACELPDALRLGNGDGVAIFQA